jgi:hypothetical protein
MEWFLVLTDVDSEIQHVHEQDSKEHNAGTHASRVWISTEKAQEAAHNLLCPG